MCISEAAPAGAHGLPHELETIVSNRASLDSSDQATEPRQCMYLFGHCRQETPECIGFYCVPVIFLDPNRADNVRFSAGNVCYGDYRHPGSIASRLRNA